MAATESKEKAMEERDGPANGSADAASPARGTAEAGASAPHVRSETRPSLLHIYKPGQGAIVRWGTAAGAGLLAVSFAAFLSDQLAWFNETTRVLVPIVALVALGILIFRLIGQNRSVVEFLIATEGEMKKVNWSTRREVIGSTKVVILVVLAMGIVLFLVDVIFMWFFSVIGVLRIDVFRVLLGGGQ